MEMEIATGNAHDADTRGTGWFLGFSDWCRENSELLFVPRGESVAGLCLKWYDHPTGDRSAPKPVSVGRTVSLLVTQGAFQVEFCRSPEFPPDQVRRVVLSRQGDFVAWGAGIEHRWCCLEAASILTLRFEPVRPGGEGTW
ncbi:hypothetical protein GMST_24660 [Geomonas silvestris]|uniref:Ureidoglycolate hydrolase n=1 Tax=Geomonas silvestris TaxID=2740184 RepID=A0A6V8MJH5_9BACT|nr:hypothetical protein [Geomonas silvestris]GFO60141.1 hypothetical protein GMST_24660 [Geomonas silvestris]